MRSADPSPPEYVRSIHRCCKVASLFVTDLASGEGSLGLADGDGLGSWVAGGSGVGEELDLALALEPLSWGRGGEDFSSTTPEYEGD